MRARQRLWCFLIGSHTAAAAKRCAAACCNRVLARACAPISPPPLSLSPLLYNIQMEYHGFCLFACCCTCRCSCLRTHVFRFREVFIRCVRFCMPAHYHRSFSCWSHRSLFTFTIHHHPWVTYSFTCTLFCYCHTARNTTTTPCIPHTVLHYVLLVTHIPAVLFLLPPYSCYCAYLFTCHMRFTHHHALP